MKRFTAMLLAVLLLANLAACTTLPEEQPQQTDPVGTEHVHAWTAVVTSATCVAGGYTTYSCACGEHFFDDATDASGHSWADATCTAPKTCTVCGITDGRAPGHAWDEGTVTQPATEENDGQLLQTCMVCGDTRTQVIPSKNHEHNYDEAVVTAPLCNEGGYTTHYCRCGASYVDSRTAATGHVSMTRTAEKAATCTQPGNIEYWYCFDCGKYFSDAKGSNAITYGETVLPVEGHTDVTRTAEKAATYTESGNIEYWYCNSCGKYFDDEACLNAITYQDTVIPAQSCYSITFHLYDNREYLQQLGVENPNQAFYDPDDGLKLRDLFVDGYIFEGWYDGAGKNAARVTTIKQGESGDIDLYARWTPVEYKITYVDAPMNENPATYTVEDTVYLTDPVWSGLAFASWSDSSGRLRVSLDNGVYRARIVQGTTGNITLTANWESYENRVNPTENGQLASVYDAETELYHFIYELGVIENVALDQVFENYAKTTTAPYTMSISESVSIDKSKAETIASIVANSVSQTEELSETVEKIGSTTTGAELNVAIGVEGGMKDIFKSTFETSFGLSASVTSGYTSAETVGKVVGKTGETTDEFNCTISYAETATTTSSKTMEVLGTMPNGIYAFVHAADIRVFALVTYDPAEEQYYVDTYCVMTNLHNALLYYKDSSDMYKAPCNSLAFDVPVDQIKDVIDSGHYVQYEGGEGSTGSMPISVFKKGETGILATNKFEKVGYTFSHWEQTTATGVVTYQDGSTISAAGGETVTLEAKWDPITYTVDFNMNVPAYANSAAGNMENLADCKYDADVTLTNNKFVVPGWIFKGWATEATGDVVYEDGKTYKNLGASHKDGEVVRLYAVWEVDPYTVGKYVANGVVVSDTNGKNSYTVYNYINETPQLKCGGKVIVDWSSCSSETHNYISAVNSTGTRYGGGNNHLDIAYGITEVFFIGNPKATYTDVCIYTVSYPADSTLTIHLKDMNLSAGSGVVNSWYGDSAQDVGMYLTIDCNGTNTITATSSGGTAILNRKNLKFTGSGKLTVKGGNGANATTAGGNGADGGIAIIADYVEVFMPTGKLTVIGGNGGNGYKGADSTVQGSTGSDRTVWGGTAGNGGQGGTGGNGGYGGNGGDAMVGTLKVKIGTCSFEGGTGGNGGNGGKGGKGGTGGGNTAWGGETGDGGKGGTGGKGGDAGHGGYNNSLTYSATSVATLTVTSGSDGTVGTGGAGGEGGDAGTPNPMCGGGGSPGATGDKGADGTVRS